MRAGSEMTRNVFCVFPHQSMADAYRLMRDVPCRHLPVVDGGRLVGMLSDRDVMLYAVRTGRKLEVDDDARVDEAMSRDVVTCGPDTSIDTVASIMLTSRIDALPVVDAQGELLGIITTTDLVELLRGLAGTKSEMPTGLRYRLQQGRAAPLDAAHEMGSQA